MREVTLTAEENQVVGRYTYSTTHLGEWRGHPTTGRSFANVDEVYFFRLRDGRIFGVWDLDDTHRRLCQPGLTWARQQGVLARGRTP